MTYSSSTTTLHDDATELEGEPEETHPLAEAGKDAKERAGHLAQRAADVGLQQADRGRQTAAEGIDTVAQSIRRFSTDMEGEQPAIANAAQVAADQAERVSQYLRQTDARQMLSTVEDAARRQPLIFLGGAFLLGVAASRFIKAAGGRSNDRMTQQFSGRSGYGTDYSAGVASGYRTSDAYEPSATADNGYGNEGS